MIKIIEGLLHGSRDKFNRFEDIHLGKANGIGYIKAHWFIYSSDIKNGTIGARLFAENVAGYGNQHYIYNVNIEVDENCLYTIHDILFDKLSLENKNYLLENYTNIDNTTTLENFIMLVDNAYEELINLDVLVIKGWTPDNGRADEYISVLTTKNNSCNIIIKEIKSNK